jgi:hypothetical protein
MNTSNQDFGIKLRNITSNLSTKTYLSTTTYGWMLEMFKPFYFI